MSTKRCPTCGQEKSDADFWNRSSSRRLLRSECKSCEKIRSRAYKEKRRKDNTPASVVRETKKCRSCGVVKTATEFYHNIGTSDRLASYCKICAHTNVRNWKHLRGLNAPMAENKLCTAYLGVVIGEQLLPSYFPGVRRMPTNNPKYDFVCPKGFKIDVKTSTLHGVNQKGVVGWRFNIKQNEDADYFACIGFDDRESLNVVRFWLIPGAKIARLTALVITTGIQSLHKWAEFEKPIETLVNSCNLLIRDLADGQIRAGVQT